MIAQQPLERREDSRLLVLDRNFPTVTHKAIVDLPQLLRAGDLLVINTSKVIPARLNAIKPETGGRIEILLCDPLGRNTWSCLVRPARRLRTGSQIRITDRNGVPTAITAVLNSKHPDGSCELSFHGTTDLFQSLDALGEIPLPPYIRRRDSASWETDRLRYQTVYANEPGSVAAPTAGLHFSEELIQQIKASGVDVAHVNLHVGAGTFAPVKTERIEDHKMHEEHFDFPQSTADALQRIQTRKGRIIAVGTTTLRVLETVARSRTGIAQACRGRTDIFIYPPFQFLAVDALLTNFHLPCSTLLMLVSAFADNGGMSGIAKIRRAYDEAVRRRYRFFSYGDAMLIT